MAMKAVVYIIEHISLNDFCLRLCLFRLEKSGKGGCGDGVTVEGNDDLLFEGTHGYAHDFGALALAGLPFLGQIARVLVFEVLLVFLFLHPQ
jgi:hypothetical protein